MIVLLNNFQKLKESVSDDNNICVGLLEQIQLCTSYYQSLRKQMCLKMSSVITLIEI